MKLVYKIGTSILFLVLISPLGLILPAVFNAKSAWGEWGLDEIKALLGYIPAGMGKIAEIWHPILPDYNFPNYIGGNITIDSLAYIFSGLVGTLACVGITLLWVKFSHFLTCKGHTNP